MSFGKVMPQAFRNRSNVGLAVNDPNTFQWNPSGDTATFAEIQERVFEKDQQACGRSGNPMAAAGVSPAMSRRRIDFLRHTAMNAVIAGDSMRAILRQEKQNLNIRTASSRRGFQMVARLVTGDFPSRVYYVSQEDTTPAPTSSATMPGCSGISAPASARFSTTCVVKNLPTGSRCWPLGRLGGAWPRMAQPGHRSRRRRSHVSLRRFHQGRDSMACRDLGNLVDGDVPP